MNFVIFPFAFFAGGIIPLVSDLLPKQRAVLQFKDSTHSSLAIAQNLSPRALYITCSLPCCLALQFCAIIEIIRNNLFAAVSFTTYGTFYLVSSAPATLLR